MEFSKQSRRKSVVVPSPSITLRRRDLEDERDERRTVLVLGATGMVGGALARALLSYPWFNVKIGTRRPWCSEAVLLGKAGCKVLEVDYNYKYSLVQAMQGVRFVFLHTHYWETYSSVLEFIQGRNVVEAALEAGVQHLVYDGTNYVKPSEGRVCNFLRSRLEIQDFIIKSGICFTIVILPFYYENLMTVFRPFEVSPDLFAIPLPLEGCAIPCGCLADMALCICKIILNSTSYEGEEVELVSELLAVQQMASGFTVTQPGRQFFDPDLSIDDFMEFDFPGAKEFASFFEHYQNLKYIPDFTLTRYLNPGVRTFLPWLSDNCAQISVLLADIKAEKDSKFIMPFRLRRNSHYIASSSSDSLIETDDSPVRRSFHWHTKPSKKEEEIDTDSAGTEVGMEGKVERMSFSGPLPAMSIKASLLTLARKKSVKPLPPKVDIVTSTRRVSQVSKVFETQKY